MKPEHINRGQPGYPVALERFLGTAAPPSDEELDFIVNYDIKYRMGLEAEDEGEE
jgi:hypothetical protein